MRGFLSIVATAGVLTTACPVSAQNAPGLAPSSPWNLHYDDDSCALRRMFGEGKNRAYLELRRFEPGMELQAVVASKRMRPRNPATFRYRFDDDAEWRQVFRAPTIAMADGFDGVIFTTGFVTLPELEALTNPVQREAYLRTIDRSAVEGEAAAKTDALVLRGAFPSNLVLRFGSLEEPIAALNNCIDELMTHWDIDVEAHKSLTRPALPVNLPDVARMIDYPPAMIRRSMPGIVNIRLAIDETGRITGCHIQMPLSDPAFEETSCADIQHALDFDPALDKDGNPIASYWVTRVVFTLG